MTTLTDQEREEAIYVDEQGRSRRVEIRVVDIALIAGYLRGTYPLNGRQRENIARRLEHEAGIA